MASAQRLPATLHSLLRNLAQLALAHCSWSLLRATHIRFVLPSASNNTSAEDGVNRLFTTAEPLSTFLRVAATWAHLQHRSAERVRIMPPQLSLASHTVSLKGDVNTFPR